MMDQNDASGDCDSAVEIANDRALFDAVESGAASFWWRCWQSASPAVVLGRHSIVEVDVDDSACRDDGIPLLRRFSGGGTVVIGPGCLNYAIVMSLDRWPHSIDVEATFRHILQTLVAAFEVPGLSIAGRTDLALNGRKVSGNAQRRGRRAMIHHGTLLHDYDARLASRYLRQPARQPAYRADRSHVDFIGNLPLTADTIRARVAVACSRLQHA
jgi:lipoate---protein ligase